MGYMVTAQHHRKQKISLDDAASYYMRLHENTPIYSALCDTTLCYFTSNNITSHNITRTPSLHLFAVSSVSLPEQAFVLGVECRRRCVLLSGEILGFVTDELPRKHLPRMFSLSRTKVRKEIDIYFLIFWLVVQDRSLLLQ